jgi:uncharacterized membrane protein
MTGFLVMLVLGVVFAPLALSITALVMASRNSRELRELQARLATTARPAAASPAPEPARAAAPVQAPALPASRPPAPVAISPALPPPPPRAAEPGIEVAVGGKVASLVGIAALVIGIVFFVGYAVQHNWIGPALRIAIGLACGLALVGAGVVTDRRSAALQGWARVLMGGGVALFYFSVFAAYGFYHLVGARMAGVGLVASAAGALGLAVRYRSQVVALLGVLGAFVTPLLLVKAVGGTSFPLVYVLVINLPVIVLGLRREWQGLYNVAFAFTLYYGVEWMTGALPAGWVAGLCFAVGAYAEFALLGLLRVSEPREAQGRQLDALRLLAAASALGLALHEVLTAAGYAAWRGSAFFLAAATGALLALAARRRAGDWNAGALSFAAVAISFFSVALPVQWDGAWVSIGWAVEGVVLAWLGIRMGAPLICWFGVAAGALGLAKAILVDAPDLPAGGMLFFNERFAVGAASAILFGVQGSLHKRAASGIGGALMASAFLAVIGVQFLDAFALMSDSDPLLWLLTTAVLLLGGLLMRAVAGDDPVLRGVGTLLLVAVPFKMALDVAASWDPYARSHAFFNLVLWSRVVLLALAAWGTQQWATAGRPGGLSVPMRLTSLGGVILLVALEFGRLHSPWANALVSLWLGVSALALALAGLRWRMPALRYFALAQFLVTVAKVFLIDLSDLGGLPRIAAFFALGLLLLVLSFVYQRIAPARLQDSVSRPSDGPPAA